VERNCYSKDCPALVPMLARTKQVRECISLLHSITLGMPLINCPFLNCLFCTHTRLYNSRHTSKLYWEYTQRGRKMQWADGKQDSELIRHPVVLSPIHIPLALPRLCEVEMVRHQRLDRSRRAFIFVLMEVGTLGVARSLGWKVHMRCANGYRQETRSMRRCVYRKQLHLETLPTRTVPTCAQNR
jgi:hypothetical protein